MSDSRQYRLDSGPMTEPVAPVESEVVTEKSGTCVVLAYVGPGRESHERACRSTLAQAAQRDTGPFQRIEYRPIADADGSLGRIRALNEAVAACADAGVEWLCIHDAGDLFRDTVFAAVAAHVAEYDAIWGLLVDWTEGTESVELRMPQILQVQTFDELLLFDPEMTLGRTHFVRTEVARRHPFASDVTADPEFARAFAIWSEHRAVKAPVETAISRRSNDAEWLTTARESWTTARHERGLHVETADALSTRNKCVGELQGYLRRQPGTVNHFGYSRRLPWHGYVDMQQFDGDSFVVLCNNDDIVALSLLWNGTYEPTSTRLWQCLSRGCELVLDIGAYTGFFSLLAARAEPNCRVLGFEPLSRNYARFVANCELNRLDRVHPIRAAVADSAGTLELNSFAAGGFLTTGASIIEDHKGQATSKELVTVARIDDVLAQNQLPAPGLVKIDVEGAEVAVLDGMTHTLETARPDLMIECLSGTDVDGLTARLQRHGYSFYRIREDGWRIESTDGLVAGNGSHDDLNRLATTRSEDEVRSLLQPPTMREPVAAAG